MPLCYLVEWKGNKETGEGLEWVSAEDIQMPDALTDFHMSNPDKPGPINKLVLHLITMEVIFQALRLPRESALRREYCYNC